MTDPVFRVYPVARTSIEVAVKLAVNAVRRTALVPIVALLAACATAPESPDADRAAELARDVVLVDTHIDVPYRLNEKMEDVAERTADGDFDWPRAREGGLDVAFMSIYVPASYQTGGGAKEFADELIDMVEGIAAARPDRFRVVTDVVGARRAHADGVVGLALGMENGAPVEDDLGNLVHFRDRGIRYITLTHSENNQICDSSYATEKAWNGLSPFGREVVAEMNRLGIMVDVSHVTDDTLFQVLELSRAPAIASHSSCRKFTPGWERNMSDEGIRALAAAGGVIQINFGSSFISDAYRQEEDRQREAIREELEAQGIERRSDEGRAFSREYRAQHPIPHADIEEVADHIDHVVELVGIDHVGLGSDFDGVGDSLPVGIPDVTGYPNLIGVLLDRGYDDAAIEKIAGGNLLRVWGEVERVAAEAAP